MNLEDERFRFIFKQMKKGAGYYLFQIIDDSLFIVTDELSKFENVTDEMIYTCLYSLVNAINNYSYEKSSDFHKFVSDYVHLSLLIAKENKMLLEGIYEVSFPTKDVVLEIEYIKDCFDKIKEQLKSIPRKGFLYK